MNPSPNIRHLALVSVAASLALGLAACASTPMPKVQMAVAEAAVQHAQDSRTRDDAPAELQAAVSKLDAARVAMDRGDYARARRLAEEVEVDAEVAELHAQAVRTGAASKDAQDADRALRDELNHKTTN